MNALSESILASVDQLGRRLGPISSLVDLVVDRIAPKMTAAACHPSGVVCSMRCIYTSHCYYQTGNGNTTETTYATNCSSGTRSTCTTCGC